MASVTFRGATRQYPGADSPAVDHLDLDVVDGEFLVLVGPSGCGKSTTLRMLAGLDDVDQGTILIGDRDVTDVPAKARDIAMVFQNYALYPHMTVADNMGFALKIAKVPSADIGERVRAASSMLDLAELLDRTPSKLSGGQRQRVAMGRAIVREPKVFLMDEPLSNLDAKLRVQTRTEIASLQRRVGVTTVYVTHDQTEAMTMADRVVVMRHGRIQQLGTPRELYDHPTNTFVAEFIGSPAMNLLPAKLTATGLSFGGPTIAIGHELLAVAHAAGASDVVYGVRPEDLVVASDGSGIAVLTNAVEVLGADAFAYGSVEGTGQSIVVRTDGRSAPRVGERLEVRPVPGREHLFDSRSGTRIDTFHPG